MRTYLVNALWKRSWLTFFLMGVSFLLFGVMTVNIFVLLKANIDLYLTYGRMVIADGALSPTGGTHRLRLPEHDLLRAVQGVRARPRQASHLRTRR